MTKEEAEENCIIRNFIICMPCTILFKKDEMGRT
jgi:hypothetical protein